MRLALVLLYAVVKIAIVAAFLVDGDTLGAVVTGALAPVTAYMLWH